MPPVHQSLIGSNPNVADTTCGAGGRKITLGLAAQTVVKEFYMTSTEAFVGLY
jgi:hypothetical protein